MSVTIQGIKFNDSEVIVSVGFFLARDFVELGKVFPKYVEAYEPLPRAMNEYKKYEHYVQTLLCCQEAVGSTTKEGILECRSTKSTICKTFGETRKNVIEVKVISLSSIIERVSAMFGDIDKLLINCEGSEIDIVMGTDLKWFEKCKYLFIQFHDFVSFLNITKEQVEICKKKLSQSFSCSQLRHRDYRNKYSKYEFIKRS